MLTLTIVWLVLPLFLGLISYLLPRVAQVMSIGVAIASCACGLRLILDPNPLTLNLLDSFGVTLLLDPLSGFFILTNGLVTTAVLLYVWQSGRSAFFYTQLSILHGCVNAVFACADFMSLYVALEVISIAVFLLIAYPRTDRTIWVALRYLFISNTAMLFYLIGTVLVYQANNSFAFSGLSQAPVDAIVLILVGLFTKGGIFVSGLWLPMTHSEAAVPVSAMLSGVAIKTGVFPLLRLAQLMDSMDTTIRLLGLGTAVLGITFAMFETDIKRIFALSTISQMGFVLAAPQVGGFYALSHGLAKATLFLTTGSLPSRNLNQLRQTPMNRAVWLPLTLAGLSIAGIPLLVGFGAKTLTLKSLLPWQQIAMNVASVGTVIVFARLISLPHQQKTEKSTAPGFWPAILLLLGGLVVASGFYLNAYTPANLVKTPAILGLGWLVYALLVQKVSVTLPRAMEQMEHLVGTMSLVLVGLFWLVLA
ncbi:MAG: cation:proton antiporter [Leptolyngbya sp. SIO4C5]|nr:cation:proton antiporter [Leptolyngbya sp. SIO4C5]